MKLGCDAYGCVLCILHCILHCIGHYILLSILLWELLWVSVQEKTKDKKRGQKNEDGLWRQNRHGDARGRGHNREMGDAWTENDFGWNVSMTSTLMFMMASIIGSTE